MNKCLAIIPARGGSKRVPRKNIKKFCGQHIIKYSIDVALESSCFDEVMVSTDDKEIANIAKLAGAEVPFFRSKKTADDFTSISDVVQEVLLNYKKLGKHFDSFCCILATNPFISIKNLLKGFKLFESSAAYSVVPVVKFSYPIQRALKIEDGKLSMFYPENYYARSQDLTPAYYDSGQFYWVRTKEFWVQKKLFGVNSIALLMSELEVHDIDTLEDWRMAEI